VTDAGPDSPTHDDAGGGSSEGPGEGSGEGSGESTPAIRALEGTSLSYQVVRTEPAGSAEEAAELQGIPLGALLRTIVVRRGDDDYLFVLIPAGRRFDWPKLRKHLGVTRLSLPDADEAQAVTGYVRYTITPFGSTRAWPVLVDASVMDQPIVSLGGGARGVNVHLAPAALMASLAAEVADLTVPEARG
jgi:Cys-tRNA(Pro)/Cys-tRNA(Cys) deacylase